jgi:hypothetical protein
MGASWTDWLGLRPVFLDMSTSFNVMGHPDSLDDTYFEKHD